ncbi:uncharacterized protein F5Z01DRAFT_752765 [Emericellopsis atlantica]|uniref:GST N-terminal domain-containing protein n=1 Tax=Emericellopsis atlantica TaxID=2614577 RepID=A0A9P8CM28_9HYPO|nr:uncharacterized protein F5Z01DRAFT_752765 [Emericellopsis atlantica]KAG9251652.1 hypothetical protein F5Z01DRAFT_752765 [Emericellopsis atlantica]
MASSIYTLFDIPTKPPRVCWSMNTWRTRLLLNYKGLDYTTEWVNSTMPYFFVAILNPSQLEYPDIQNRLSSQIPLLVAPAHSISVAPNEREGSPKFTCPALQMPGGSYVMDSYKIAEIIEQRHPEPTLPLNAQLQSRFQPILVQLMTQLTPVYVPGVAERFLSEHSLGYFIETRREDLGMDLEVYRKQHGPGAFDRAEPFAQQMSGLLNEVSSGPFFLGDVVTYTDFIWAGILLFFERLGGEEYPELLKRSGDADLHKRFLDALSPWTKRDD